MAAQHFRHQRGGGGPEPADFIPGSASLCEHLDRNILVILRDGRHLIGKVSRLCVILEL